MKRALFIAGPTASGKSALSLQAADVLDGIIINADSMQVYKELPVLTACPSADDEKKTPHRLYRFLNADQVCSAAFWADKAMEEIESAWLQNKTPIVVGGTGMYFKILIDGIAKIPDIPHVVRRAVRQQCEEEGSKVLHGELSQYDTLTAARLPEGDSQRICRAVEVYRATGIALSVWQQDTPPGPMTELDKQGGLTKVILSPDRDVLYDRCNRRFDQMITQGALDEVRSLDSQQLPHDLPVMRALGVPSLIAYLRGQLHMDEALNDAKMQTRRFAKRQLTWFRNQFSDWNRLSAQYSEREFANFVNKILKSKVD
ncbi:tRNA (adenosine(37)-N6)-dimethylallyltransferase MiaA [Kordiimonas aquimaris]|uniref:tRNA (adenosine(37)-N6)-dimethylallyltransferase MiaA n=1 Tax=Kordiimonas aquimaris TaxID=707591 RepID=UPI0021D0E7FA|nr:tRNA (adenosine(37)-N6)-dimethylallyltransferase MiaA [Kordiimonas aquimaris]